MNTAPDPLALTAQQADAGDAAPAADSPTSSAPALPDDSAQWQAATRHILGIVRAALPEAYAKHWTEPRVDAVAVEVAAVAKHYGWPFASALNHPVLRLALAAFPLAWPILEPRLKPYLASLVSNEREVKPSAEGEAEPAPRKGPPAENPERIA